MAAVSTPQPPVVPPSGGWVHGLVHGLEVFGIAFAAALGLFPHHVTRDAVVAAVLAGIRAVFATLHH